MSRPAASQSAGSGGEKAMEIAFGELKLPKRGAVVVGVLEGGKLTPSAAALDKRVRGALTRALPAGRFKGKKEQLLEVVAPAGLPLSRIVLLGLGKAAELDEGAVEALGGRMAAQLAASGEIEAGVMVDALSGLK